MRILTLIICFLACFSTSTLAQNNFRIHPIPDSIWVKMQGKSVPKGAKVNRNELRYLHIRHFDHRGKEQQGELICHESIANDLIEIFHELYKAKYPIERMRLIEEYNANDEASMTANNTSCFCYRTMVGSRTRISKHGLGLAIDINPLYNPYVKGTRVAPKAGAPYAHNRNKNIKIPMLLQANSLPVLLFKQHGFRWGGDWKSSKDYQHFEK